jgi:acyl-CoA synthetase (AMP-forming)/AMP-acid ligase II/acyl carrier protein
MNDTTGGGDTEQAVALLLSAVAALAAERHPGRLRPDVELDSRLDHDLGYDSLARAQLLSRLEKAFGVTLADRLAIDALTPRDFLLAVRAARPEFARALDRPQRTETHALEAGSVDFRATAAKTFIDVLVHQADRQPDAIHAHFYADEGDGGTLTYRELMNGARRVASGLIREGVQPGESVALMLPSGRDYFLTFFGSLLIGAVPVPVYPPARLAQLDAHLRRQAAILVSARAVVLVTTNELRPAARVLVGRVETLRSVATSATLSEAEPIGTFPRVSATDTALLQYTSGSTGTPKGVALTHANLLANVRGVGVAVGATQSDVLVNWLPLYHDMGLIGSWLGSLYHGVPIVLMSPLDFLARPVRWLQAIHRYRGSLSPAPNFAFELCLRRVSDDELRGLDLSCLRSVLNGAERVHPETIERFLARFGRVGFSPATMRPVYGLAESAAGLTFSPLGRQPWIDVVQGSALTEGGEARPADPSESQPMRFVSCGRPLPDHEVRIVDDQNRELPERRLGRIQFRGPSSTAGYVRDPVATADLLRGEWLETGDLGYQAGGELFPIGRAKDIIIKAGRNIYPEEIEAVVGGVTGIRAGSVVAFGSPDPTSGTERLVVLAETRVSGLAARQNMVRAITEVVTEAISLPPDHVVLTPAGSLPKTSSGKLRRSASREMYEAGAIGRRSRPLWLQLLLLRLEGAWTGLRLLGGGRSVGR